MKLFHRPYWCSVPPYVILQNSLFFFVEKWRCIKVGADGGELGSSLFSYCQVFEGAGSLNWVRCQCAWITNRALCLSHSSSGSTVYNVCAEEEEEDGEGGAATRQSLENSITMNKMRQLKAKMEDMNLNKKVGICWNERPKKSLLNFTTEKGADVVAHLFIFPLPKSRPSFRDVVFWGAPAFVCVFQFLLIFTDGKKQTFFSPHSTDLHVFVRKRGFSLD